VRTEASASFFAKKEAKKLLIAGGCGACSKRARSEKKFFASFFQKEALASFVSLNDVF